MPAMAPPLTRGSTPIYGLFDVQVGGSPAHAGIDPRCGDG